MEGILAIPISILTCKLAKCRGEYLAEKICVARNFDDSGGSDQHQISKSYSYQLLQESSSVFKETGTDYWNLFTERIELGPRPREVGAHGKDLRLIFRPQDLRKSSMLAVSDL